MRLKTSKQHLYPLIGPKKELGQNFLHDEDTANKMVSALNIETGDIIVEIGPGRGALTSILAKESDEKKASVFAIEIDELLIPGLREKYGHYQNMQFIQADILRWLPSFMPDKQFKVLGSLPYYITSPIIHAIVKHSLQPEIAVMMVQKEVAKKIKSLAPDGSYMSNFVQAFYDVEIIADVSSTMFRPSPRVESTVICLTKKKHALLKHELIYKFEGFLHKGFSSPRKMLNKVFDKNLLIKMKIDPTLRAEHLTTEQWVELFKEFTSL